MALKVYLLPLGFDLGTEREQDSLARLDDPALKASAHLRHDLRSCPCRSGKSIQGTPNGGCHHDYKPIATQGSHMQLVRQVHTEPGCIAASSASRH